ncbi:hypothetical protein [Pseudoclavibacter soli]|uniref:hypothetical protein n=1 Tax=Pseudoclavibacter soli TaxID=452623 RepID=UPI00040A01A6|nr:hypothetical protein [Pseudoclavibacter soli]
MSIRRASLAAVFVALVAMGTTGCSLATPAATLHSYNASDGINITVGDAHLNNIALVSNDEGTLARLIGQVSNVGTEALTVSLAIDGQSPLTWNVEAGKSLNLEDAANEQLIADLDVKPGATVTATATSGSATESAKTIPVISGALSEYASLVPTPATADDGESADDATESASPAASESATASPAA